MLIRHFRLATVFGVLRSSNSVLTRFSTCRIIPPFIQIQLPFAKLP